MLTALGVTGLTAAPSLAQENYTVTGSITLKDQLYMRPRLSDTIPRTT